MTITVDPTSDPPTIGLRAARVLLELALQAQRDAAGPSKAGDDVTLEDRPRDELDQRAG